MDLQMPGDTPLPVKRQLRQEAGFGCCACGNPIIQYHHIIARADVPHFDPAHMMGLCPTHHTLATARAITEDQQRQWKARPYNIQQGHVRGLLYITESVLAIETKYHVFFEAFSYEIDREVILAVRQDDDGQILVTLKVYEEPLTIPKLPEPPEDRRVAALIMTGGGTPHDAPIHERLLFSIVDNEWITGHVPLWDVEFAIKRLTIRTGPGKIRLNIDARNFPITVQASLWRKAYLLSLGDEFLISHPSGDGVYFGEGAIVNMNVTVDTSINRMQTRDAAFCGGNDREERMRRGLAKVKARQARDGMSR